MDSSLPRVVIVMSTFNGERYLTEQMASLLAQTYRNIRIIVRDDGSSDRTWAILQEFARNNSNISVLSERNIGVVGSFLQLLCMVPSDAELVALCDQDDVWRAGKIERAVSMLMEIDQKTPTMYCGAVEVVDENLNHIKVEKQVKRGVSLENALVQNVATGCTVVINKAALSLVTSQSVSSESIAMHDWWLYQVLTAFGLILVDDVPMIQYRQHGGNVIGTSSGMKLWMTRVRRYFGVNDRIIRSQAKELLRVYGSTMCFEKKSLIADFLEQSQVTNVARRSMYAIRTPVFRQSFVDDVLLRVLIVLARI